MLIAWRVLSGMILQVSPTVWVIPKIGVPQNGWFKMENPIKMDDLGGKPHYFWKHQYRPIYNWFLGGPTPGLGAPVRSFVASDFQVPRSLGKAKWLGGAPKKPGGSYVQLSFRNFCGFGEMWLIFN